MTVKGLLRFLIATVLMFIVFSIALPLIGIPKNQILPPGLVYASAHGKADGYITDKSVAPSPNIFKAGDTIDLVSYRFRGPSIASYGKPASTTNDVLYTGKTRVTSEYYEAVEKGQTATIKYDPTYPKISGIDAKGAGMTGDGAGALLGLWILFDMAILVCAYFVAMALERIMLRESY